jgi:hypothetical protein
MRKNIGEGTSILSEMVRRTEVDVENERGATARRTDTIDPPAGDRRRVKRKDRHRPSRRPHGGLARGRP